MKECAKKRENVALWYTEMSAELQGEAAKGQTTKPVA